MTWRRCLGSGSATSGWAQSLNLFTTGCSGSRMPLNKLNDVSRGFLAAAFLGRRRHNGSTLLKVAQVVDVDAVSRSAGEPGGEIHGAEFSRANPGQNFVDADAPLAGHFGRSPLRSFGRQSRAFTVPSSFVEPPHMSTVRASREHFCRQIVDFFYVLDANRLPIH